MSRADSLVVMGWSMRRRLRPTGVNRIDILGTSGPTPRCIRRYWLRCLSMSYLGMLQQRRSKPKHVVATGVRTSRCHMCLRYFSGILGPWPRTSWLLPPKPMRSLLVLECPGMPSRGARWRFRCCSGSCAYQAPSAFVPTTCHDARLTYAPLALLRIFV